MSNEITKSTVQENTSILGGDEMISSLETLDTETLKSELAKSLAVTAEHLRRAAAIFYELQRRGEDMSGLKSGLVQYLRLIAEGRLHPDLVVRYASQQTLLTKLSRIPLIEQYKLAQDGTVVVVQVASDGTRSDVPTPLLRLGSQQVSQVFSDDGIRSPDDQYERLSRAMQKSANKGPRSAYKRVRSLRIDEEEESIIIGDYAVPIWRVVAALSDHYEGDLSKVLSQNKKK